jgi:hypothetical protein
MIFFTPSKMSFKSSLLIDLECSKPFLIAQAKNCLSTAFKTTYPIRTKEAVLAREKLAKNLKFLPFA